MKRQSCSVSAGLRLVRCRVSQQRIASEKTNQCCKLKRKMTGVRERDNVWVWVCVWGGWMSQRTHSSASSLWVHPVVTQYAPSGRRTRSLWICSCIIIVPISSLWAASRGVSKISIPYCLGLRAELPEGQRQTLPPSNPPILQGVEQMSHRAAKAIL